MLTNGSRSILCEQSVIANEHHLHDFLMQVAGIVAVLRGPLHVFELANHEYMKLVGPERMIIGKSVREALPEVAGQGFFELLDEVYRTGKPYVGNHVPLKLKANKDGCLTESYVNFVYQPALDANGDVLGILVHGVDVTEEVKVRKTILESDVTLRQSQAELQRSEQRFRLLADSVPVAVWVTDNQGNAEFLNKHWCDYSGVAFKPTMASKVAAESVHPEDIPKVMAAFAEAMKTGSPWEIEQRNRSASGEYRWFLNRCSPYRDPESGEITHWFGVGIDIHDKRQTEDAIRASEVKFRTFFESNMLPIAFWNTNGHVYESNDAFAQLMGYTKEQIADERFSWLDSTPVQYRHLHEEGVRAAIERKTFIDPYEVELIRKNGDRIAVLVGYTMLEGSSEKGVAFFLNVSEQRSLMNELERRVDERTNELQRSNHDLQQFAHVASHDLKEPVRKMTFYANRLMDEITEMLNQKQATYLNKIMAAAGRMRSMIDGVLTYSTMNASEQKVDEIDLNEIVSDVQSDLELLIAEKNAVIHSSELPKIEGAHILIHQLFYNLLSNALKFSDANRPPVLSITSGPASIDSRPGVAIKFTDNGIGFESDYAEAIFESFTRLNPRDKFDGTGLGLALCKRIAERHGGRIEAKSIKDVGSAFIVQLPRTQKVPCI
jgi:PAS domain S-box-containing protein